MAMNQPPSRPPSAPMTGWEITAQVERDELDARGQPARGMRVYFTTGKGISASVFFPQREYNPDNVRATVAAQAATIDQVHALKG